MADDTNYLGDLYKFVLDVGRAKWIDVEMPGDSNNINDRVDVAEGQQSTSVSPKVYQTAIGGIPLLTWAVLIIGGAFVFKAVR